MAKKDYDKIREEIELVEEYIEDLSYFYEDPVDEFLDNYKLRKRLTNRNIILGVLLILIGITIIGYVQTNKYGYDPNGNLRIITGEIRQIEKYYESVEEYYNFALEFAAKMEGEVATAQGLKRTQILIEMTEVVEKFFNDGYMPENVPDDFKGFESTLQLLFVAFKESLDAENSGVVDLEDNGLTPQTNFAIKEVKDSLEELKSAYNKYRKPLEQ